ncbi:MAG: hypothetical protein ABF285_03170, partial [Pacificibacter sp.]
EIADQLTPKVSPDAEQTAEVKPDEEAAAPQEATTEIVTEAETPSGMSTSPRPKSRPQSIATQVAQKADDQAKAQADEAKAEAEAKAAASADAAADAAADAIAALAAEAVSETPAAPKGPLGPPLSYGERDALRSAIGRCWNKNFSQHAKEKPVVVVAVSMNRNGTPIEESITLSESFGGSEKSVQLAFVRASNAIKRCGARGLPLPVEKFDRWEKMLITFDSSGATF